MTKPKKMQMGGVPRRPMTMPSRATMTGPAKGSALSGAPGGRGVAGAYNKALNQAIAARNAPVRQSVRPGLDPNTIRTRALIEQKRARNVEPPPPVRQPAEQRATWNRGMNKTMPPVPPYQDPTPMDTTMRNDLPPVRRQLHPGLDPNTIQTRPLGLPPARNVEPPPPAPFKKGGKVTPKGKTVMMPMTKAHMKEERAEMPRHMAGKMPMKMAAGGVAKIRHQQVNKGGRPPGRGPGMKGGTI